MLIGRSNVPYSNPKGVKRSAMLRLLHRMDEGRAVERAEIASFLLPRLACLVSPSPQVLCFMVLAIKHPKMTIAYLRSGQCPLLLDLLQHSNSEIRAASALTLKRILRNGPGHMGLCLSAAVVPHLQDPRPYYESFAREALHCLISDSVRRGYYGYFLATAFHGTPAIRAAAAVSIFEIVRQPKTVKLRASLVNAGIFDYFNTELELAGSSNLAVIHALQNIIPLLVTPLSFSCSEHPILRMWEQESHLIRRLQLVSSQTFRSRSCATELSGVFHRLRLSIINDPKPLLIPHIQCQMDAAMAWQKDHTYLISLLTYSHAPFRDAFERSFEILLDIGPYWQDPELQSLKHDMQDAILTLVNSASKTEIIESTPRFLPRIFDCPCTDNFLCRIADMLLHSHPVVRRSSHYALLDAFRENWEESYLPRTPLQHRILQQPKEATHFKSVLTQLCRASRDDDIVFVAQTLSLMIVDLRHLPNGELQLKFDEYHETIVLVAEEAAKRSEKLLELLAEPLVRLTEYAFDFNMLLNM
jgi:hypothetical protein